jgi:Brp/Blh family beta-carotene 15,15'-monooxygenase
MLALAVVIFGLPHGALDLALVQGASRGSRTALVGAAVLYLMASGLVLMVWISAPMAALLGFLAIAVIHFGLGDTEDLHGPQRAVEIIARGGFAGVAPLVFHPQTTRDLFALLVGPASTASLDTTLAVMATPVTWLWLACLVVALAWRTIQRAPGWMSAVLELLLTAAIFAVCHPLAAFLLYFCFVHSVRHIADLGAARFPDSAPRARRWLLLESLPFTAATVALAMVAWFVFADSVTFDEAMIRLVFWGLSALTVPHMILTAWWHGRGEPQPGDLFARHV